MTPKPPLTTEDKLRAALEWIRQTARHGKVSAKTLLTIESKAIDVLALPPSPPLEEVRQEGWREAQRWLVEIFELNAARKMEMMLKERETAALRSRTATPDAGRKP